MDSIHAILSKEVYLCPKGSIINLIREEVGMVVVSGVSYIPRQDLKI